MAQVTIETHPPGYCPAWSRSAKAIGKTLVAVLASVLTGCAADVPAFDYTSPPAYQAPLIAAATPTALTRSVANVPPGWLQYHSPAYGFRIAYPPTWTVQVAERDSGSQLGSPSVELVALLLPREWADRMERGEQPAADEPAQVPLVLEITSGTWDQYRMANAAPTESEQVSLGGQVAICEIAGPREGVHTVRYLLPHPTMPDVRVTIIDSLSGFPDRLAGNEALLETYLQVLGTIAFE